MSLKRGIVVPIIGGAASGGTDTSDATAVAGDIRSAKTAYGSAGTKLTGTLNTYTPPMMQFDGSTGYYNLDPHSTSGSAFTVVCRFNRASFTGDVFENLFAVQGGTWIRVDCIIVSSDHSTLTNRRAKVQVSVTDSGGTNVAKLISSSTLLDGADHFLFFSYNGGDASTTFYIDGSDEDDTGNPDRVTPTTGTLESGASGETGVGANHLGSNKFGGDIGTFGYRDAYLTNYTDFMDGNAPKELDESGWTEWGAQPLFWNEYGFMENNKGSAGDMTKNGTIDIADFSSA